MTEQASGFLARWARRKEQVKAGVVVEPEPTSGPTANSAAPADISPPGVDSPAVAASPIDDAPAPAPLPTMADVAQLSHQSDYSRFVLSGVDEDVKCAAMKKLFTDPHFNVMDGLDIYIDDYSKPDPIPLSVLRQMNQSKFLRLFEDDSDESDESDKHGKPAEPVTPETFTEPTKTPDDDPDMRLQQDDASGQRRPDQGAGA